MQLFSIMISTVNQPNNVRLLFSDEKHARAMYDLITGSEGTVAPRIHVDDQYGNHAFIRRDIIAHVVLTDLAKSTQGDQDIAIFNAHAQIKLQKRADADEDIKRAMVSNQLRANLLNGGGVPRQ